MDNKGFSSKDKIIVYILMSFLVTTWGFDYVVAKHALEVFQPITLLFLKYLIGMVLMFAIKAKMDGKRIVRKKDIPLFILCSIFGEIMYFACEYTAMDFIPVSLITIILSFVPALAIIVEKILYKRRVTKAMVIGVITCIFGVALVIGVDFDQLVNGRWIGYLLAFGAVISWTAYNFLTASLHENYSSVTMTCTQLICTSLIILPYALHNMPPAEVFTGQVCVELLYLGLVNAGLGFLINMRSLHVIGPTACAMFSNFLPITSTFFGWIFLHETISAMQFLGGAVVIASACIVIYEKGKIDG